MSFLFRSLCCLGLISKWVALGITLEGTGGLKASFSLFVALVFSSPRSEVRIIKIRTTSSVTNITIVKLMSPGPRVGPSRHKRGATGLQRDNGNHRNNTKNGNNNDSNSNSGNNSNRSNTSNSSHSSKSSKSSDSKGTWGPSSGPFSG